MYKGKTIFVYFFKLLLVLQESKNLEYFVGTDVSDIAVVNVRKILFYYGMTVAILLTESFGPPSAQAAALQGVEL